MQNSYIRIKQLISSEKHSGLLPIQKSTLYRWIKEGRFPSPIKLGPCVSAWPLSQVLDWIKTKEGQNEAPK